MKRISKSILFILFFSFSVPCFSWNHSIQIGYGRSHDPNFSQYYNSGFLITSDLFPIYRNCWSFWSITGAYGRWYTTAPHFTNITTGALSLALRLYPRAVERGYQPYFLASFGPAILSHRHYGLNTQAKNITIQSNLGLGMEINCIDVNLRISHYSNAKTAKPNNGFNILYVLSVGYLF